MWVDIFIHGALLKVELGLYSWTFYHVYAFTGRKVGQKKRKNHDRPLIRGVMPIVEDIKNLRVGKTLWDCW